MSIDTGKLSPEELETFAGYPSEVIDDGWVPGPIQPKRPCRRCGDFCGQEKPHREGCKMMAVNDPCTCPS